MPWISTLVPENFKGCWIEPFMGTGVVGFNVAPKRALMCDTNPHLINFYKSIQSGEINHQKTKNYLEKEGSILLEKGEEHYYYVRDRFNDRHEPLDFLFLNRAGFNGMIRFNRKGEFNIPFCRKPNRFAQAYITKIINQIQNVQNIILSKQIEFKCQEFEETLKAAKSGDLIYCDPPYIDRHTDYFNSWNQSHELKLFQSLSNANCDFILSTWHHNDYRKNEYIESHWSNFKILTQEHFYHVGGKEKNRSPMVEAIATTLNPIKSIKYETNNPEQLILLDPSSKY